MTDQSGRFSIPSQSTSAGNRLATGYNSRLHCPSSRRRLRNPRKERGRKGLPLHPWPPPSRPILAPLPGSNRVNRSWFSPVGSRPFFARPTYRHTYVHTTFQVYRHTPYIHMYVLRMYVRCGYVNGLLVRLRPAGEEHIHGSSDSRGTSTPAECWSLQ